LSGAVSATVLRKASNDSGMPFISVIAIPISDNLEEKPGYEKVSTTGLEPRRLENLLF